MEREIKTPYGTRAKKALVMELCRLLRENKERDTKSMVAFASLDLGLKSEKVKEYISDLMDAGYLDIIGGKYVIRQ